MDETSNVKVLVVDGASLTRFALVSLINLHPVTTVCDEADTAPQARSRCIETRPDLIVIDIDIDKGDGINLIKELHALHPPQRTLVVSGREELPSIQRAFGAGARAYVSKLDDSAEIISAIDSVLAGRLYMSPRISYRMLEEFAGSGDGRFGQRVSTLSNRELHIFRMIGHRKGASAIAEELGVSVKTIETHQQRIKEKLHLKCAHDLHRVAENWCARIGIPSASWLAEPESGGQRRSRAKVPSRAGAASSLLAPKKIGSHPGGQNTRA
jgi:DNA-binding NarL/FixJ family response regulator